MRVDAADLRDGLTRYGHEMANLTAELVAQDTGNPPGRNAEEALRLLAARMAEFGLAPEVSAVPGRTSRESEPAHWLHCDLGSGKPIVYFHGHIDVVPAQSREQFQPVVTDEAVIGRGAGDMKGGLVSMVYAMRVLAEHDVPLRGRIALRVVPDEETGGQRGSRRLSDAGLLVHQGAIAMLTAEPTGGIVWNASRGAISGRVMVRGRPAHVGLQHEGVNAFEHMLAAAQALRALKAEAESHVTQFPIEPFESRRSILLLGGEVRGGSNFNVVPDMVEFTFDRRLNPEEDFEVEKSRLLGVIRSLRAGGLDVGVEIFQEARPAAVPSDHRLCLTVADAVRHVRGERPGFALCPGILDTRFYVERGVPAVAYGPGDLALAHGPDEHVSRQAIADCALAYALTAAQLLA